MAHRARTAAAIAAQVAGASVAGATPAARNAQPPHDVPLHVLVAASGGG